VELVRRGGVPARVRVCIRALLIIVFAGLLGCGPSTSGDPPEGTAPAFEGSVVRVVDGDTFEVRPAIDGTEDVRLIGIDTPEPYGRDGEQPLAAEATRFTRESLAGSGYRVELRFDVERKDDYGRVLAYAYLEDGRMLNELLVSEGYAQVSTFPPNVRHLEEFGRAQGEAREAERGIWGLPDDEACRLTDRGNGIGGC
jgi:micrococcal nuclease